MRSCLSSFLQSHLEPLGEILTVQEKYVGCIFVHSYVNVYLKVVSLVRKS